MIANDKVLRPKVNGNKENFHDFLHVISDNDFMIPEIKTGVLSDSEKIDRIEMHFGEIMKILGLSLEDPSLKDTPKRVAKMYVNEIFSGLNPLNKPKITLFNNNYGYNQMLVEKNIRVQSFCEHHFVPIIGKAHVAYISAGPIAGLSKLNRIVEYYARRPQVQERLTEQIAEELKSVLRTDDVAVIIEADHMCVTMRGIKDEDSSTTTSSFHGKFLEESYRKDFLTYIFSGK